MRLFVAPDNSTAFIEFDGDNLESPPVGFVDATQAQYDAANAAREAAIDAQSNRMRTFLQWSPSKTRVPAQPLNNAWIAGGSNIAIFVEDIVSLGIISVDFKLDAVSVNVEGTAPWDYGGTDGFGNAIRVVIPIGLHVVDADITDADGVYTVSANIEVE